MATFKIEASFNITRPGEIEVIVVGLLLDGIAYVESESTIEIQGEPSKVTIKSVGWGKPDQDGNIRWGLQLKFENSEHKKLAILNRIQEQIIKLYR